MVRIDSLVAYPSRSVDGDGERRGAGVSARDHIARINNGYSFAIADRLPWPEVAAWRCRWRWRWRGEEDLLIWSSTKFDMTGFKEKLIRISNVWAHSTTYTCDLPPGPNAGPLFMFIYLTFFPLTHSPLTLFNIIVDSLQLYDEP